MAFIFRDLFADARQALAAEDPMPAAEAMATLVDIACETGGPDYFRSEDPVEAAKIVISGEAGALWRQVRDHAGPSAFAALAAPQLIRWEREHGWTRSGWGQEGHVETRDGMFGLDAHIPSAHMSCRRHAFDG